MGVVKKKERIQEKNKCEIHPWFYDKKMEPLHIWKKRKKIRKWNKKTSIWKQQCFENWKSMTQIYHTCILNPVTGFKKTSEILLKLGYVLIRIYGKTYELKHICISLCGCESCIYSYILDWCALWENEIVLCCEGTWILLLKHSLASWVNICELEIRLILTSQRVKICIFYLTSSWYEDICT